MSIVPSVSDNEQEISNSITRFIFDFKVGSLLKQCGCKCELCKKVTLNAVKGSGTL